MKNLVVVGVLFALLLAIPYLMFFYEAPFRGASVPAEDVVSERKNHDLGRLQTLAAALLHPGLQVTLQYVEDVRMRVVGADGRSGSDGEGLQYSAVIEQKVLKKLNDAYIVYYTYKLEGIQSQINPENRRFAQLVERVKESSIFALVGVDGAVQKLVGNDSLLEVHFWQRYLERFRVFVGTPALSGWRTEEQYSKDLVAFEYKATSSDPMVLDKYADGPTLIFQNTIRFNSKSDRVESMEVFEKLSSTVSGAGVTSLSEIDLNYLGEKQLAAKNIEKLLSSYEKVSGKPAGLDPVFFDEDQLHRRALGDMELADIFALFNEGMDSQERSDIYFKARAWIYLNSGQLALVKEKMQGMIDRPGEAAIWGAALTYVGTPEAQAVLVDLIDYFEVKKWELAANMMTDLMMVEQPSVASEQAMRRLSKVAKDPRIGQQADYTIGTFGYHLRSLGEPVSIKRADLIRKEAEAELLAADTEEQRSQALGKIGNLGDQKSFALVMASLSSKSLVERQEAVTALRFMGNASAEKAILDTAESDANYGVRLMAVKAYSYREPTLYGLDRFAKMVKNEANVIVRGRVMSTILSQFIDVHAQRVFEIFNEAKTWEEDPHNLDFVNSSLNNSFG